MRATREVVRVDRSGEGGEEDVPRVGRDVTGQECMTGCRRGIPLCGKSILLTLKPTSSRSTFSRKLTNDWLSFVAAAEFLKSAEISSEVRFSIISVRFVCDISYDRTERFDAITAETICESAVSTFRCSERARGFRELQTRAFCEKSYAHSVPKKPQNVDSRLVLTGKIASDRTLALFRIFGCVLA